MTDPYEVRIPLRTENISLPQFDVNGLEVRETARSGSEDRRDSDKDFELIASFEAAREERDEKKGGMHERAQRLGHIISFLTGQGVVAETPLKTYRSDKRVQVTETSGTTVVPNDWGDFFIDIYTALEKANEIDEEVLRALRWYTTGVASEHHTDRFLAFWLALEIQAESQEKSANEIDPDVEEPVEQAMAAVRKNIESNYVKSRVNDFIAEYIRDETIPEAIAQEILDILGENHSTADEELESKIKSLQNDRSNLVHHGKPIDDVKRKATTLESYNRLLLKRKLDPIFSDDYDSDKFPEAAEVPLGTALQIILADHPDGLTKEELRKEAFAATRDFEQAARIVELIGPAHDLENLGIVEDTVYKLDSDGPVFVCPVCDDEFEVEFSLTRHLADADSEETDEGGDYHSGEHGEWRAEKGLAENQREWRKVDAWITEHREEVMVENEE
ncbi:hypothetical protein JMJ58_21010 (plasmid) [Haloterrigena salifodinae]|uniref:Uncharacterized protein n=1 Tax=Haloterrigena salifodinae TaxID=2675099 RepID=A0A8T8E6S7_9EURY|nr:HEPN domain-containing protein [Haloterrigena salifodinae]QRV17438.1 hypothetical protein JMJ58_21010 [Haloterrigena salifodinae]